MDIAGVVSLVGVLGIGSIAGQYLAGGGQRRQTRAEVLRALGQVEAARWAGTGKPEVPFRQAARDLDTTALLARLPRVAVVHYKELAQAGLWVSTDNWEDDPDPEYGGGIDGRFADIIQEAASEVSHLAWSPWRSRVRLNRRIRSREERAKAIDDTTIQRELKRSRDHPPS